MYQIIYFMKRIFLLPILLFLVMNVSAQVDRSQFPKPKEAPEIKFGKAESFELKNGLKVFVINNQKLPRVTFSLILDRDPILEKDKAGMLDFVGEMLTAGTKTRTKDQFNEEIDFIGARISATSSSISGSSLTKHQEKVVEMMADVLFNPVFPAEELTKLKTQAKSGLALSKNEPSAISGVLSSKLVYGTDHPYGESETEQTLDNITIADFKQYHSTYFKPNIAYLAIVGDIDVETAKKLVNKYFAAWKKGNVPSHTYALPKRPEKNIVAMVDRPSSQQTVINVTYPLEMDLANPDYLASRVVNFVLGGGGSSRLFMNLREDKGYTYGAYSSIGADKYVASFRAGASVRGTVTDSAMYEIIHEIKKIANEGITEAELAAAKANINGSFGRSLESPSTIANFAINIERYKLPSDYYATYLQRLNALTVEDVNAAARKTLHPDNMYLTVVGNAAQFETQMARFGEVKKFTNTGDPEKRIEVSTDVTSEDVLNKYLNAIGGEAKLRNVKTATIESQAEIQGMKLTFLALHNENEAAYNQKVMMMGNVASNVVVKGDNGKMSANGQSKVFSPEEIAGLKPDIHIFPELHYQSHGLNVTLDGIKEIEGEQAYKVVVSNGTAVSHVNYYSVKTGLKIMNENPKNGDTIYSNYEEVEGIKVPMKNLVKSPMIPMPIETVVQKIEFNANVQIEGI
jgi:zinc protease